MTLSSGMRRSEAWSSSKKPFEVPFRERQWIPWRKRIRNRIHHTRHSSDVTSQLFQFIHTLNWFGLTEFRCNFSTQIRQTESELIENYSPVSWLFKLSVWFDAVLHAIPLCSNIHSSKEWNGMDGHSTRVHREPGQSSKNRTQFTALPLCGSSWIFVCCLHQDRVTQARDMMYTAFCFLARSAIEDCRAVLFLCIFHIIFHTSEMSFCSPWTGDGLHFWSE